MILRQKPHLHLQEALQQVGALLRLAALQRCHLRPHENAVHIRYLLLIRLTAALIAIGLCGAKAYIKLQESMQHRAIRLHVRGSAPVAAILPGPHRKARQAAPAVPPLAAGRLLSVTAALGSALARGPRAAAARPAPTMFPIQEQQVISGLNEK